MSAQTSANASFRCVVLTLLGSTILLDLLYKMHFLKISDKMKCLLQANLYLKLPYI